MRFRTRCAFAAVVLAIVACGARTALPTEATYECPGSLARCEGDPTAACTIDTGLDSKNCGACGVSCGLDEVCGRGRCVEPRRTVQVVVGSGFTCALRAKGTVLCWGFNSQGQLGDLGPFGSTTPKPLQGVDDAIQLSILARGCARRRDRSLSCWGANYDGLFGSLPLTDNYETFRPSVIPQGKSTAEVLAEGATCYLGPTGRVSAQGAICIRDLQGLSGCWGGAQPYSQTAGIGGPHDFVLQPVDLGIDRIKNLVACQESSGCAVSAGHDLLCWGELSSLGIRGPLYPRFSMSPPQTIASNVYGADYNGRNAACVVDLTHHARCFGSWAAATGFELGGGIEQIALGTNHLCALRQDGTVGCWGDSEHGRLGGGAFHGTDPVLHVSGIDDAIELSTSAFSDHTCALRRNGDVLCWGDNHYGQLGDGTVEDRAVPVKVVGLE